MTDWSSYRHEDFLAPTFEVVVGGKTLEGPAKTDVMNVSYRDTVDQLDSFEIVVNNWDRDKERFKYSAGSQFDPGQKLELHMGYKGKIGTRLMIRGEVTALRPRFPSESFSRVTVSGLNVLHTLRGQQVSEVYIEMKDSEIAELIGSRLGVTIQTDGSAKAKEERIIYLIQDAQYDIVFLYERARRLGYDLFVKEDGETVYFGPSPSVGGPRNTLRYGDFALEFEPQVSIANQVRKVTVHSWDPREKKLVSYTAGPAPLVPGLDIDVGKRQEVLTGQPVESGREAQSLAEASLLRIRQEMVTGHGRAVGIPELRAGTVLELRDLDRRFSGEYFVTATTHIFDDQGYRTLFDCRKEPR